jgi:hypothetical protein
MPLALLKTRRVTCGYALLPDYVTSLRGLWIPSTSVVTGITGVATGDSAPIKIFAVLTRG